jgi:hypothetical protein
MTLHPVETLLEPGHPMIAAVLRTEIKETHFID